MSNKQNEDGSERGVSRRAFLGLLGLTGVGAMLGCENNNPTGSAAHAALPDPVAPAMSPITRALVPDTEFAPPAPSHPLPPPVVKAEPANTYGILPRSMWARGGPDMSRVDPMNGVKLITFHHSGDPKPFWASDFGETAQHLEYVREYHRSRNFQDIGYHFAIDRVGRVWQLRSLKFQGQHVRYNNEHNVGVVVLGNFDMQPMTQQQKDKVRIFGTLLRKQYSLPISRVYTHQEIVSTECPGHGMQPYMVSIRRQRLI
ncbi:MAG TPA: peptidoglycan recognition family protein [Phycisphaerae bacterium]|nr:peptidoglycan recognition family protein [Phycisphaerae bacterium]